MSGLNDDKLKELLAKQSKGDLVEWIVEQAGMNEDLRRELIDLVGPEADVKTLLSELRRMITRAWQRTRTSRHPWKLARPISSDLAPVVSSLEQLIERGHAVEAEKVLQRFVEAADKGFTHVDDSSGLLWPLCQEAVALWGKAWAQIEPRDPAQLAQMVYGQVQDDGFALRDHMIRDFAAALGRKGLLRLKDMFLQQHKARQADEGPDDWQRSESLRHVAEVADALGDVGRTKAYHHAADYLAITHDLAGRADLSAEQQEMLFHLREKHGRKYSFWERVNE